MPNRKSRKTERGSKSQKKVYPTPEELGATWLAPCVPWKAQGDRRRKSFLYPECHKDAGMIANDVKRMLRELEARASMAPGEDGWEVSPEQAEQAVRELHKIAVAATEALNGVCHDHYSYAKNHSKTVESWPLVASLKAGRKNPELRLNGQTALDANYRLQELEIQLTTRTRVVVDRSKAEERIGKLSRAMAESVRDYLLLFWKRSRQSAAGAKTDWHRRLAALPDFSKATALKWWPLAKEYLDAYWHHEPARFDGFRALEETKPGEPRRDIIDRRIKEAFRRSAPK
jgi:hypothetical protein